jgi:hypothetical protein
LAYALVRLVAGLCVCLLVGDSLIFNSKCNDNDPAPYLMDEIEPNENISSQIGKCNGMKRYKAN